MSSVFALLKIPREYNLLVFTINCTGNWEDSSPVNNLKTVDKVGGETHHTVNPISPEQILWLITSMSRCTDPSDYQAQTSTIVIQSFFCFFSEKDDT